MSEALHIMQLEPCVIHKKLIEIVIFHHLDTLQKFFISGVVHIKRSLVTKNLMLLLLCEIVSILLVQLISKNGLRFYRGHLVAITVPLSFDEHGPIDVSLFHFSFLFLKELFLVFSHEFDIFGEINTLLCKLLNSKLPFTELVLFDKFGRRCKGLHV